MPNEFYTFVFCFIRTVSWVLFAPFFLHISSRIKVCIAVVLALFVSSIIKSINLSDNFMQWIPLILSEITIGVFLGLFVRVLMLAIELAAYLIGFQLNLSNASVFNPSSHASSPLIISLLSLSSFVFFFQFNLHYSVIKSLVQSYEWLPFSHGTISGLNKCLLKIMNLSLEMAVKLSCPVVIVGSIFYLVIGLISRILSGLQIFFVMIPAQILINITVFIAIIIPLIRLFITYLDESLMMILP